MFLRFLVGLDILKKSMRKKEVTFMSPLLCCLFQGQLLLIRRS